MAAKAKKSKKTAPAKKKKAAAPKKEKKEEPVVPVDPNNPYNITIVNMVASANFHVELDLFSLAKEVEAIEYEPEQFPGAILKLTTPKASLLLFKNGKVICTGARSEEDVERALHKTADIVKDYVT